MTFWTSDAKNYSHMTITMLSTVYAQNIDEKKAYGFCQLCWRRLCRQIGQSPIFFIGVLVLILGIFGSILVHIIDSRISKIQTPRQRHYVLPDGRIMSIQKPTKLIKKDTYEGFQSTPPMADSADTAAGTTTALTNTTLPPVVAPSVPIVSPAAVTGITAGAAATIPSALIPQTPFQAADGVTVKLPINDDGKSLSVSPAIAKTHNDLLTKTAVTVAPKAVPGSGASGQNYINPLVCKPSQKHLYYAPDNKSCTWGDRHLYKDDKAKSCSWYDRSMYVSNQPKCKWTEKMQYDKSSPENMRMELEQIELRRSEISKALNIPLDKHTGIKLGCQTDSDCNIFSRDPDKKQNVCKSDNTCFCGDNASSGPFCQYPSRYKDPKDMSSDERERFMALNDLSKFTVRDYYNWLLLYWHVQWRLSDDHLKNLKRFANGEPVTKLMIPRERISPPATSKQYYDALTKGVQIQNINFDTAGPYLAYNTDRYGVFVPPEELDHIRIINDDLVVKQDARTLSNKISYTAV